MLVKVISNKAYAPSSSDGVGVAYADYLDLPSLSVAFLVPRITENDSL